MSRKLLTRLTPEQEAAMAGWAEMWIERGLVCEPAEWDTFTRAAARCYAFAGLDWHRNVVRVDSPLVASAAAAIATYSLDGRAAPVVRSAVGSAVRSAVDSAVDSAVGSAVDSAVDSAVRSAVGSAVRSAVDSAVDSAVGSAVRSAVDSAVGSAVRSAVDSAVDSAVGSAVRSAVDSAVDSAVRSAVGSAVYWSWYYRFWGQWSAWWPAFTSFFRDVCDLELPGDTWERDRAYADAQMSVGWWFPHTHFIIVSDRPAELHLERIGQWERRLHREDGPAASWRDGYELHFWHGFQVPAWVTGSAGGPTPERIAAEPNVEVRRAGIEAFGWDRFTAEANLALVAVAPDPANPGCELGLYDVPERLWGSRVRLLLATNGSAERDGTRRRYGITTPAEISDPVAAAGWSYDLSRDEYAALMRRT